MDPTASTNTKYLSTMRFALGAVDTEENEVLALWACWAGVKEGVTL